MARLLTDAPAALVSFVGAEAYTDAGSSPILDMSGKWAIFICSGWNGTGQEERRKGAGAGFDLMHRAAAAIHGATLTKPNGDPLPQTTVEELIVRSDSALDISNLWVGEIAVSINLPLELVEGDTCYGPLDDFLKVRATFDLPGGEPLPDIGDAGTEGDLPARVDLPQT